MDWENKKFEDLTLKDILKVQKKFQHHFYDPETLTDEEKTVLSKEFILAAHRELGEILNLLPWKNHRKYSSLNVDRLAFVEEAIDSLKFILNLFIVWGITSNEIGEAFVIKSDKVEERYKEEHIQE